MALGRWAVLAVVGGLVTALIVGVAVPAGAAEIDDLRNAVASAREATDAATARYMDAVNEVEGLEVEIAGVQRQIDDNRQTIADLKAVARERAVTAYKRHGVDAGAALIGDPLVRLRREKLLQQTNARDDAAIGQLDAATESLAARERELHDLRAAARDARDRLAVEQAGLEQELEASQAALTAFEERLQREEAARQERERALLAAQRSTSSERQTPSGYVAGGLICPIRGPVSFIDSWGFPRATTGWHKGVDLMTPRGTPNVAVVPGRAEMHTGGTSGLGVWLYGDDGNLYYYFHLEAYEGASRHVEQGEVVGYAGNTGDASGGATHTHFEVHPGGGPAVNPYSTVAQIC